MPILSCCDLTLGYEGKAVLSGVRFEVNPGDYLCIVGENGSGKSTLLKALLGLQPPLAGSMTMDCLKCGEVGYLPQQTAAQKDFPASVGEVVRSGLLGRRRALRPFYTRAERRAADAAMQRLGILPLAKCCYRELSGGQQQRALLARAVCATRRLLLADEPAAGLDPAASAELYTLLADLHGDGVTILMISHDMAAALRHATHILHIGDHGQLFFGAVADYLQSDVCKAYTKSN